MGYILVKLCLNKGVAHEKRAALLLHFFELPPLLEITEHGEVISSYLNNEIRKHAFDKLQ